jgi:hypothetical protein
MGTGRALAAVSTAQFAAQVAGLAVALRRRLVFDVVPLRWHGARDAVVRDGLVFGTPISAPSR